MQKGGSNSVNLRIHTKTTRVLFPEHIIKSNVHESKDRMNQTKEGSFDSDYPPVTPKCSNSLRSGYFMVLYLLILGIIFTQLFKYHRGKSSFQSLAYVCYTPLRCCHAEYATRCADSDMEAGVVNNRLHSSRSGLLSQPVYAQVSMLPPIPEDEIFEGHDVQLHHFPIRCVATSCQLPLTSRAPTTSYGAMPIAVDPAIVLQTADSRPKKSLRRMFGRSPFF